MPSAKGIFLYWESKGFTELPEVDDLLVEWGQMGSKDREPWQVCWSCAQDELPVDRAHLLARVYGGLDTPANLVMLCRTCHLDQPDYGRQSAISWINKRAYLANYGVTFFGELPLLINASAAELARNSYDLIMLGEHPMSELVIEKTEVERKRFLSDLVHHFGRKKALLEKCAFEYEPRDAVGI